MLARFIARFIAGEACVLNIALLDLRRMYVGRCGDSCARLCIGVSNVRASGHVIL